MKTFLILLSALLSFSAVSSAQVAADNSVETELWENNLPQVKGLVRRIEPGATKIMIKHEEIPNLSMPAMTMTFVVSDPAMVKDLKPNDKILFSADMIDNELTLVWIEKQ